MNPNINEPLILNVDDTAAARYAKTRVLTRAGFQVIEAASGGEALELAKQRAPDLVLLDVKLPDINGFEVCRLLKKDPQTQMVLILQTSASFVGSADKIRALDGGADNYLVEPIEPEELIANVKALLRLGSIERQLRDADRRKDEFLATLAHELRNPLAPIRNAVELMGLDPGDSQQQENARRTIIRQTDHMVRLIDDLLDVARITQGKITLQPEPVEVKTFISAAIETAKPIIASRQHRLQVHLPEHDLWIKGDAVRMTQICGNLLHNAAKFTPPGGNLAITVEQSQDSVVITVKDNGIGISTENMSAIFGLFSQGEHAPDRVKDGLGIGLSLVKTLIELHGGTVRAVSDGIGMGSSFELRLPSTPLTVDYSPQKEVALQGKGSKLRILVVDDNVDSADLLGALLEYEGNEVQTSYNGAGAIECALRFRPDFVFLDIGLPDISGYQVASRLRQLPQMENAVLVALTGYGQEKDKTLALEAGFNVHLVKPLALDTLRLTIRRKTEPAP